MRFNGCCTVLALAPDELEKLVDEGMVVHYDHHGEIECVIKVDDQANSNITGRGP